MENFNDYVHETHDQRLHDILALMSELHGSLGYQHPKLLLYVLRVCKHALVPIKEALESSSNPNFSRFARVMQEIERGNHSTQ